MNKDDRVRAFSMRCDGMTWTQIGSVLRYDPTSVYRDLHRVLEKPPHSLHIIYPAIEQYITDNCNGSIEVFAHSMQVSPHRLRRVLVNGDPSSERLRIKVCRAMGMREKEVFKK